MHTLTPCKFSFNDSPSFEGFAHGSQWNGFDNVAVTPEVRDLIATYFTIDGDPETAADLRALETMDNGLVSFGWGYTTTIENS